MAKVEELCDPSLDLWPNEGTAPSNGKWVAFSYTHVEHPEGDLFGLALAICSLIPIFLVVSFVTLIIFRRDLHTIFFFAGMLLNEITNMFLKRLLGHLRPCSGRAFFGSRYAMPSNHSQFVWFFAAYMICFLFIRLRTVPVSENGRTQSLKSLETFWKTAVAMSILITGVAVSYSRVYLHYHSLGQVLLGSCLGASLGISWFVIVQKYLTPTFPIISGWWISEFLLIRDTSLIPNILFFEYSKQREEASIRFRKLRPVGKHH